MDGNQPLTRTSSKELSLPSNGSNADTERRRSIAALLNRLALHCPLRNLPKEQAALLLEDTINDLMAYEPYRIAEACEAWRRGPTPFFPTSGQLIALIPPVKILTAWDRPAFRAPKMIEGPRAEPKPWRQILAEHNRPIPPIPEELDETPPTPAAQEVLDENGQLSEERRAELRALREKLAQRAAATA